MATVVIPRHADIGKAAAEDDDEYFSECFVDTGITNRLLSPNSSTSILVGRTGGGKSAIIRHIQETNDHVCVLEPESLSLNFLADSWVLQFLTSKDFDLGLFYQQLWRHVLVIELLRHEKGLSNEGRAKSFLAQFTDLFKDNNGKKRAFEYLTKYGGEFWEDTEQRVKHIATEFENQMQSELGNKFGPISSKVKAGEKVSNKETQEFISKAQKITNSIQMQELSKIIDILNEDIFCDRKKKVILLIDDLDRQWADERIRIKLIEALINVLPKFRKIQNIKILVAMRDDLLDNVLAQATTPGFQRDKFQDYHLRIKWNIEELRQSVEKRINKLFKNKYVNENVSMPDILVDKVSGQDVFIYICDRTMMRPRDIIAFFNLLFGKFGGKAKLSQKDVRSVELDYSTDRRRALVDEWRETFPFIDILISFLGQRKLSAEFRLSNIDKDIIDDLAISLVTKYEGLSSDVIAKAKAYFNNNNNTEMKINFIYAFVAVLYRVGALGIKTQANSRMQFSFVSKPAITDVELNENTPCLVHPMLWQALSRRGEAKNLFD